MYQRYQKIGFFLGPFIFAVILSLPLPQTMEPEALRVAAVAALMAVWWITEAIPIPATALLPIALYPILNVMPSAQATRPYANHLIFLFMGGFFIAVTMEKWNLHKRIALHTIRLVGTSPGRIILGFMIATAFLSMWISNTATAMMMLPIALAVANQAMETLNQSLSQEKQIGGDRFKFGAALMLGIAYAASVGGVSTIIGTPPNTILVGFIEKTYGQTITFAGWIGMVLPLSVVMLLITWIYLVKLALPPEIKELPGGRELIRKELKKLGAIRREEMYILLVFTVVAMSWILRGFIEIEALSMIHDATIAILGALLLFVIPVDFDKGAFLLDWSTAVKVPWHVILLFGGGFALAEGFQATGLAQWIGQQLLFLQNSHLYLFILAITLMTVFLTEVTSNTATSAMLIPIMGSVAIAMAIHPYGPIIAAGIAASYAFMLPVATPPNAVVFGSRFVTIPTMARVGFILNLIGVIMITLLVLWLLPMAWQLDLSTLPAWLNNALLK